MLRASETTAGIADDRAGARSNIQINSGRLWSSLMDMAAIGPGIAGGNNRQALTDEDAAGRNLFRGWCEEAGMTVGVDQMGTMFALRAGTDPDTDPICVGSHLDTQPTGGKFDGVLGVLAGLELVRTLNDLEIETRRPIVVANWTNEEGTRFAPAMLASGVFAGVHELSWAHAVADKNGVSVSEELRRLGWLGDEKVGKRRFHAYLELHIEQGPILEAERKQIGVVTHGQGLKWLRITLTGKEAHTGSTPMAMRVNAGLGMARITQLADEIARSASPDALAAVGQMQVLPNSVNTIPGKAVMTVDFRHRDRGVLDGMEARLRAEAGQIAAGMGLGIAMERIGAFDPVTFDEHCVEVVRRAAQALGYSHMDIVAGAGHDACWINRVAPTAMIMCPCVDGLSHNEAEDISEEWATAGANVLLRAALEMAVAVTPPGASG